MKNNREVLFNELFNLTKNPKELLSKRIQKKLLLDHYQKRVKEFKRNKMKKWITRIKKDNEKPFRLDQDAKNRLKALGYLQ